MLAQSLIRHSEGTQGILTSQIERQIREQTAGLVRSLRVKIDGDLVVVTGTACSFYAKQLVSQAAMAVSHQFSLSNQVKVA